MVDQKRNIATALPQWRNVNGNNMQPVIQLLSEPALLNRLRQILIRLRNDADIDIDCPCPAHALKAPLL